jgi:signal transduction histidine kinase
MSLFVRDLLKQEIFTIESNDPIKNAAKVMNNLGISCLIVTSEGLAVGIITERDIMKSIMFDIANIHELPVKNFMSNNLITIRDNATVGESLELMTRNRIKKLPVKNEEGTIVGIVSMTDIVYQQPELLSRSEELTEVNEGLDSYTYTVAHDLKAPLRHIASYGKILKDEYGKKLDDTAVLYIDRMIKATDQMNCLIEDLLGLAKVDKIEMDETYSSLNTILEQIGTETSNMKFSQVNIDCQGYQTSNAVLVTQLFTNLISNGIKFNKSNPPRVTISSTRLESGVLFKVHDNGIGIDKENHSKIFELFTRLHTIDEFPGTGAGLTICKKIVDKLGGSIRLESQTGQGTSFFVELPNSIIRDDARGTSQVGSQVVSFN